MGKRRTDAEILSLHEAYCAKRQTFQDFVDSAGVDRDTLRADFRRLSLDLAPHGDLKLYENSVILAIHEEYMAGASINELGKKHKIDASTIRRNIARLGLPLKDQEITTREKRQRTVRTCLARYGVEHVGQVEQFQQFRSTESQAKAESSRKKTLLATHGVTNISQIPEVKEKKRQASMTRYGVPHVLQAREVVESSTRTRLKQRMDVLTPLLASLQYKLLDDYKGNIVRVDAKYQRYNRYRILHEKCNQVFEDDLMEIPRCPYCFGSNTESELLYYAKSLGYEVLARDRSLIRNPKTGKGLELDILIPDLKVAFEYNGVFWHGNKPKVYHQLKTQLCSDAGWKLYHIWEHNNLDIVRSRMRSVLGKLQVIGGRKTQVVQLSGATALEFFTRNHLQGYAASSHRWGLMHGEDLVAALCLRKHRDGWEISRYCAKLDTRVAGGFTKLLKASRQVWEGTPLVSYADRDWSPVAEDTVYYRNGFTCLGDSGPMLEYFDLRNWCRIPRQALQRHKLGPGTGTANEILAQRGIVSLWNSGNWKFKI